MTDTQETPDMTTRIDWPHAITIALGVLAGAVATAGTLSVAMAGFTLSYDAIRNVGIASGIRAAWAWQLPVSVDGAMAVATVTAVVMTRLARANWYPWLVVIAGAGISIACNAVHAQMREVIALDDTTAMAVSAIPAVMLALSVHLLVVLVSAVADVVGKRPAPDNQPTAKTAVDMTPTPDIPQVTAPANPTPAIRTQPATPDTAPDDEQPPAPVTARVVKAPARVTVKATDTATRLAKLRVRQPAITQVDAAAKLQVSERTVARYWADTAPDVEPVKTNGHAVPDLVPAGGAQ